MFGLPAIIHSDNGKEFVNKLTEDVVSTWPFSQVCSVPTQLTLGIGGVADDH